MKKRYFQTSLLLLVSVKISIIIAVLNSYVANFIWKKYYPFQGLNAYHTLFYSYPLIIGLLLTFYDPRNYGLLPANTVKYWRICLMWFLIIIIPILTYLKNVSSTPFHGMSWQVFIMAPIGEELIFRGAFFTWIQETLTDIFDEENENLILILTIVFSALAFGAWHIPNIMVAPSYTISQISYTTILGIIFGYLRYKTESIYICIFIHCVINFLATIS